MTAGVETTTIVTALGALAISGVTGLVGALVIWSNREERAAAAKSRAELAAEMTSMRKRIADLERDLEFCQQKVTVLEHRLADSEAERKALLERVMKQ